uniref:MFS domain-containing protein n=1 Tax=Steinernema glaseri TaxID=37863 RepID=A0A1I7YD12_9BILA
MNSALGIKLATFMSQNIVIVLFVVMALIGSSMPLLAEVLMTLNIVATAFHFIGVMAAAQAVAQQHTQVLSSSIAAIESIFGLMLPPFVSYVAPDHTPEQWAVVFYSVVAILTVSNLLFLFLTKVEPAEWTKKENAKCGLDKKMDSGETVAFYTCRFCTMIRYVVLALTLTTMSILLANTVLFNFTVICMKPENRHREMNVSNETRYYSSTEEGWIIAAPSVGLVIATLPTVYITQKRGLRQTFTFLGICSGLMTLAYPFLADNIIASLITRFIQGFAVASAFVAMGIVPIEYGGLKEKGLFVSVLTVTYELGPFTTIPASAVFCSSSFGWEGVYYLFGVFTLISFALFFFFYRNTAHKNSPPPRKDTSLASDEVKIPKKRDHTVPYRKIFLSTSVWGVLNAAISDSVGYLVFLLYGPIYVNKVLNFDIGNTGLLVAFPHAIAAVTKLLSGAVFHRSTCMSSALGIRLSTFISMNVVIALFVAMALIGSSMPLLAEVLMTVNIVAMAFHFIGVMTAAQIIAEQHTQVISSAIAAIESVFGLLLPPFVSYVAPNHTAEQWAVVFYYVVAILTVSNFLFMFLTKIEQAEWTKKENVKCGLDEEVDREESV